ncbi:hypothetical protein D3C76_1492680 [compost metagenome]
MILKHYAARLQWYYKRMCYSLERLKKTSDGAVKMRLTRNLFVCANWLRRMTLFVPSLMDTILILNKVVQMCQVGKNSVCVSQELY